MSDPSRFDALYAECRDRLLVQAFALTGDLTAARGAVRDTFVVAWHHWSKLRRVEDPEAWLRPQVWTHAQRRHTARIWHRDRKLDPSARATLDALAKLSGTDRRAVLLDQLADVTPAELAREVGLPREDAERRLAGATAQLVRQREVDRPGLAALFDELRAACADQRWPRAPIVRRAGTGRRRARTLAGAVLAVATLIGGGLLVQDVDGVRPTLAQARERVTGVAPTTQSTGSKDAVTAPMNASADTVSAADLLSRTQLRHAVPGQRWQVTGTGPARGDSLPCQRRRFAGPRPRSALVRNFTAHARRGHPALAVVQAMELSADTRGARRGYDASQRWFAECLMPHTQLLSVRRVAGLGDRAEQFALRVWKRPAATLVAGIARTGKITTVTLTRSGGSDRPDLRANLRLMASAVTRLCHAPEGGSCSRHPRARFVAPPKAGEVPVMLSEFDLPAVAGVTRRWVSTTPRTALQNVAATGCDQSSFHGHGWRHDVTRTFLVPGARLARSFGLTETVGLLPPARARTFVAGVRTRLAGCPDRELGTEVVRIADTGGATGRATAWQVRVKVADHQTVTFLMGLARFRGAVAQVGFVADGRHTLTHGQFVAVVKRAQARLTAMRR